MQAIVTHQYGSPDVLELREVDRPAPGADEVLVRVRAASLNALDWRLLRADPFFVRLFFGWLRPKVAILGADVAGVVEAVGQDVSTLEVGDEVFGDLSNAGYGAYAEYVCVPARALARKPANASFEESATLGVAALTALQGLRDHGNIRAGQRVLVHGASGGVGTFAVQIARALGAEVTAVCSSGKVEMVRGLGAERVIDYTREDFASNGTKYDIILVANGKRSILDYRRALEPGGIYVLAGGAGIQMFQVMVLGPALSVGGKKLTHFVAKSSREDLEVLGELVDADRIKPVIDRRYPLADMPEALRYLEEGHARGKVVVTVPGT